jgi:hypothetical protein
MPTRIIVYYTLWRTLSVASSSDSPKLSSAFEFFPKRCSYPRSVPSVSINLSYQPRFKPSSVLCASRVSPRCPALYQAVSLLRLRASVSMAPKEETLRVQEFRPGPHSRVWFSSHAVLQSQVASSVVRQVLAVQPALSRAPG